jgi:hypothetical protein
MFRYTADSEQALLREKSNWNNAFAVANAQYQTVHNAYTASIQDLTQQLQKIDRSIHSSFSAYTGMITHAASHNQDDLTFAAENIYGHWMTKIPTFPPSQYLYAPPEPVRQSSESGPLKTLKGATVFIDQIAVLLGQWKADQNKVMTHVLPLRSLSDGEERAANSDSDVEGGVRSDGKTMLTAIALRIQQVSTLTNELERHKTKIASTASEDPSFALASSYTTVIHEKVAFFEVQTKLIQCYSELWLHFQSLKYLVLAHVHQQHLSKLHLSVQHTSLDNDLVKKTLLIEQWRQAHTITERFTNEYKRAQDQQIKLVTSQETIYTQLLHKVKQQQHVVIQLLDDLNRSTRTVTVEELPVTENNMLFASQLAVLDMFLQLIDAANASAQQNPDTGSKCNLNDGPVNFRFHQLIRGKLLHPKYRSRGYLDGSPPGYGKTGGALCGVREWVKFACEAISRDRHGLVLLPNDRAFVTWQEEILKMLDSAYFTLKHTRVLGAQVNVTQNCHRITITQHTLEPDDDETVQKVQLNVPFVLTFQVVLYSLPAKVAHEYAALPNQAPEWDVPFETYTESNADMYTAKYLPDPAVRRLLHTNNEETIAAVLRNLESNKVAVPSRGLVIVDEIHLLIDPLAEVYTQSYKTLAWLRKLRMASGIKLYAATGTLALTKRKAMNVIRTLTLWKQQDQAQLPHGVYRASLSAKDRAVKNSLLVLAYRAAEDAEVAFLEDTCRKNVRNANDEAAAVLEFQQLYTGFYCHAALDRDPMLFPQINHKGVEMNVPFVLTSDPNNSSVWMLNKKKNNAVTVDGWKWMYLPATGANGAAQFAPVTEATESSWKKINSVELLVPMPTQQFRKFQDAVQKDAATSPAKAGDSRYFLDYTNYKLATSIYRIQFSQLREKLDVLEQWVSFHPMTKHAAFTDVHHIESVRSHAKQFAARHNYDMWGISKVLTEITNVLKNVEVRPLHGIQLDAGKLDLQDQYFEAILGRIYEDIQQDSSDTRRMLYLGNDTTKENLKTQLADTQRTTDCPFTIDFEFCGRMLFRLWNHYDNGFGKYFSLLFGDRSFRVGFNLLDTKFIYFLEPPANPTDARQRADRINRMCGMPAHTNPKDWSIHVIVMINTVPLQYQKAERVQNSVSGSDSDERVAQLRKTVEGILPAISMTSDEYQYTALSQNGRVDILDWMVEALNDVAVDKALLASASSSSDTLTLSVDHTGTCAISSSASSYPQEISSNDATFHLHELDDGTVTFSIQRKDHQMNARELKAYCQRKEGHFQMAPVMLRNQALLLLCLYHLQRHKYADEIVGRTVLETILATYANDSDALLAEINAVRQGVTFSLEIPMEEIVQRLPLGTAKLLFDVLQGLATDGSESEIIFLPWALSPQQQVLIMRFLMMRWYNLDMSYKTKMLALVRGLIEYAKDEMSMEESQDELTRLYQSMKLDTENLEAEAKTFASAHVTSFPVNPNIGALWKHSNYAKYDESMMQASTVAENILHASALSPYSGTAGNGEMIEKEPQKAQQKSMSSRQRAPGKMINPPHFPAVHVRAPLSAHSLDVAHTSSNTTSTDGHNKKSTNGSNASPRFVPELFTYVEGESTDEDESDDELRHGHSSQSVGTTEKATSFLHVKTKTHTMVPSSQGSIRHTSQVGGSESDDEVDKKSDDEDDDNAIAGSTNEKEKKAKNKIIKMPDTKKKRRTQMKGPF